MIDEHNSRAWLAWHIAALTRTKQLPQLHRLLAEKPKQPQSWQEQLAVARKWAALRVGTLTPATPQQEP